MVTFIQGAALALSVCSSSSALLRNGLPPAGASVHSLAQLVVHGDGGGRCYGESTFGYILDGHVHLYTLPGGENGEVIHLQCEDFVSASTDKPYRYGSFQLRCDDGTWTMIDAEHTHCARDGKDLGDIRVTTAAPPGSCPGPTKLKTTIEGHHREYVLGSGRHGQVVGLPCNHGPYGHGEIRMRCEEGRWQKMEKVNPCSRTELTKGSCRGKTVWKLSVGDHHDQVELGEGKPGEVRTFACKIGPYTKGEIDMKCVDGDWDMVQEVVPCSRPGTKESTRNIGVASGAATPVERSAERTHGSR